MTNSPKTEKWRIQKAPTAVQMWFLAGELLIDAGTRNDLPATMIIGCEAITYLDTTGTATLAETIEYCERYGVEVALARVHDVARGNLDDSGDIFKIGEDRIYATVRSAVDAAIAEGAPTS